MTNPWDRPPLPTCFDVDIDSTFAGVGRVLSQWEELEVTLARLYARFRGEKTTTMIREYGEGRIFKDRIQRLINSASLYFTRHPNQNHEGGFDHLVERCLNFSARRNDIAHGHVVPTRADVIPEANGEWVNLIGYEFCLFPPHYDPRRHSEGDPGCPEYGYTRPMMDKLESAIEDLNCDAVAYLRAVFAPPEAQKLP